MRMVEPLRWVMAMVVAASVVGCKRGTTPVNQPDGQRDQQLDQRRAPPNDELASATEITELPFEETIDARGATVEPDAPVCGNSGATVWYRFTPAEDMFVLIDSSRSNYETNLSVFRGPPDDLEQLVCVDVLESKRVVELQAGETYHILIGARGTGMTPADSLQGDKLVLSVRPL